MSELEPRHITPEHLVGFGRIALQWATVEAFLIHLLCSLMELEEMYGLLALNRSGFNDKRDLMRSIVDTLDLTEEREKEFSAS